MCNLAAQLSCHAAECKTVGNKDRQFSQLLHFHTHLHVVIKRLPVPLAEEAEGDALAGQAAPQVVRRLGLLSQQAPPVGQGRRLALPIPALQAGRQATGSRWPDRSPHTLSVVVADRHVDLSKACPTSECQCPCLSSCMPAHLDEAGDGGAPHAPLLRCLAPAQQRSVHEAARHAVHSHLHSLPVVCLALRQRKVEDKKQQGHTLGLRWWYIDEHAHMLAHQVACLQP
jgi:hypothetical protein